MGVRRQRARISLPLAALRELWDLDYQQINERVLDQLWPGGCPAADLRVALQPLHDLGQRDWLARQIVAAQKTEADGDWIALVGELGKYPKLKGSLPNNVRVSVAGLAEVERALKGAGAKVAEGDTKVLARLYLLYTRGDKKVRDRLAEKVPDLLVEARRLEDALRGCPPRIRYEFCAVLRIRLSPLHADPALAALVFRARQAGATTRTWRTWTPSSSRSSSGRAINAGRCTGPWPRTTPGSLTSGAMSTAPEW